MSETRACGVYFVKNRSWGSYIDAKANFFENQLDFGKFGGFSENSIESRSSSHFFRNCGEIVGHSCKPRWVVADMAFFTPSWMVFWKTHGVKTMPTGRATPWPNRAETAVRLFKREYEKLLMEASTHPTLNKVTLRDLIRECCWARNTTLTISGYTPVELATGRRPTDHSDLELMKPDQLSVADLPRDATLNELRKLALKAHLEVRQSADLRRDLARRVLPSDGPYAHGDRVFVWIDDKAKYKAVGRWARARVHLTEWSHCHC